MRESRSWLLIIALIGFVICVELITEHWIQHSPPKQFLVPPPEYIEQFHFGFNETIADTLWLRWIQDSDNCQTYLKPAEILEPVEHKDVSLKQFYNPRHKVCDGSWAFKMLDAVTKLAPLFKMPYLAGGISLAVITEDYEGATKIFERGIRAYPDDWNLLYRASYHFLFDLNNKEKAAELMVRAGEHGAPYWVASLASRLYSEAGQLELGIRTLESLRKTLTNPLAIKDADERLAEMKRRYAKAQADAAK